MKLSVLVPVYNEAKSILTVIGRIEKVFLDKEIILVDDYSDDGTREFLRDYCDKNNGIIKAFYHDKNIGKGAAVKTALNYAEGDYAIIQDGDLEYDPQDYIRLLDEAERTEADVVYGSRFLTTWRSTSFPHFLVNKFLTVITNILYGSNLTDMETCYKMIRTDLFKRLNLESERFEIEPEITAKLLKRGYKITEVPISYKGRSYHEGKKITWKDGIATLWALVRFRYT